jgi:hypothetical protein
VAIKLYSALDYTGVSAEAQNFNAIPTTIVANKQRQIGAMRNSARSDDSDAGTPA